MGFRKPPVMPEVPKTPGNAWVSKTPLMAEVPKLLNVISLSQLKNRYLKNEIT